MKILSLHALNINSLQGEVKIDFREFLEDNALFAITGATGSGKSTLLDIISCALYGKTPRLKNPLELMSRGSGECYCEVTFEVKKQIYTSFWGVKRARKKSDGKFQTPKMEISSNGKVIATKSREVIGYVEELTGLDFRRFIQSMLLAQGGFDAFLKADEKERSALLEKITKTEIYADISQAIYEKYADFTREIELLKASISAGELLSDEELKKREDEVATLLKVKEECAHEFSQSSAELQKVQRFQTLETTQKENSRALEDVEKKIEAYSGEFHRYEEAKSAQKVLPTLQKVETLQKSLAEAKGELKEKTTDHAP